MIRGGLVTLNVKDLERAVRFYIETLGMKLVEDRGANLAVIDAGDGFLLALRQGEGPASSVVTLFTKVPLAEAVAIYENRGVSFDREAQFRDPDDNVLRLAEPAAS